jgi:glycosyltransferase involved in cell wall biosynthesis
MSTPLSFVIPIKNRTHIYVEHDGATIELRLFEKCLQSLFDICSPRDKWEIVIVDFISTDVDMKSWVKTRTPPSNCTIKVVSVAEKFNRGKGVNIGVKNTTHDVVLTLDTDMQIFTRTFFDDIEKYVVREKKVMFPICWSYSDPEHLDGWKRVWGTGINCILKSMFIPIKEFSQWGNEDTINEGYFRKQGKVVRPYYGDKYVHQWHPNDLVFKNRFYAGDSGTVEKK